MSGMAAMWFWSLDTSLLSGFGSGACLVSFYLRVGGGIFSKGAELGPSDMNMKHYLSVHEFHSSLRKK